MINESEIWQKYKSRLDTARPRLNDARNEIITIRATKGDMHVLKAVELTDNEFVTIKREMGGYPLTSRGYYDIYTKADWIRAGYPIIKKLDSIPLWKSWRNIIKRYR